ncbi:MAG: phosphate ABC transporter permease subunit PstC [Aphanocapsa feldmannii 277cV]|uniref:Phosphate transport system permease protein n=2 Tax=Aphanocapsa feldmannii TaxID=192050 RepID=A0A524RLD0_9CHRO|nr:MAG: phosphate ABC transporter permease subunit PstC [Aphanocapsa feldmannii 288cV]TGG90848.1 MAG: phosphate ABC transporter permease subunit PstC [Aphanocapsa feldmannii 277cV]
MGAGSGPARFTLRQKTPSERLVDQGFVHLTRLLASMVGVVLALIFLTVLLQSLFQGNLSDIFDAEHGIWHGVHSAANEDTLGLLWGALPEFGLSFLSHTRWDPVRDIYGAFPSIYGTLLTSLMALAIAVPIGVGTAVFLTEDYLPEKIRTVIGFMVELLAAIPSVVLGLWAFFIMEPFLRQVLFLPAHHLLGWIPFFSAVPTGPNTASAVMILVVMVLPIITAISRDSLNQLPIELRQGAYAVGTTRWGTVMQILVPAAISGIVGGTMLALGRALGETMAVTMIIGNSTNFNVSWFSPGGTIASLLANQFGEAEGMQVSALYYAALVLIVMTFLVNVAAQWIVRRLSLRYE